MADQLLANDDYFIVTKEDFVSNPWGALKVIWTKDYDSLNNTYDEWGLHFLFNDNQDALAHLEDVSISNITLNGLLPDTVRDRPGYDYARWTQDSRNSYVFFDQIYQDLTSIGMNHRSYSRIAFSLDINTTYDQAWTIDFNYTVQVGGETSSAHATYVFDFGEMQAIADPEITYEARADELTNLPLLLEAYAGTEATYLRVSHCTTPGVAWDFNQETGELTIDESQFDHLAPGEFQVLEFAYQVSDGIRHETRTATYTIHGAVPDVHADENGNATGTDYGEDVFGSVGDDTISAGGGDDVVDAGEGSDVLDGGHGSDLLDGGAGDDTLSGGEGDDRLEGGEGNDVLEGGEGNDVLEGGEGNDVLEGGEGLDTYVLAPGSGEDRIIDDGGIIEMLADIPGDYLLMTLYEVNGNKELHIDLLDEEGNKTGDRLIIENFDDTSGGPSGGGILDWKILNDDDGDDTLPAPHRDIQFDGLIKPGAYIIGPGRSQSESALLPDTIVRIIDFNASDLRFMRDADSPDDLMVYFRDEPNISIRIEDHFDAAGETIPAVKGIKFHNGETLSLEEDLTLEGTEADEVILASYHEDLLIGGGGDDTFRGSVDELQNDTIHTVSQADAIEVLGQHFSYQDVHISSGGLLLVDLDGDQVSDLQILIDEYHGNGFTVTDNGEFGTRIEFSTLPPSIEAHDIAVAGGARINLSRLFDFQDPDGNVSSVKVTFSVEGFDGSSLTAEDIASLDWGIDLNRYLDTLNPEAAGIQKADGTMSFLLSYDEYQSFDFLNLGEWRSPGTEVKDKRLVFEDQPINGHLKVTAEAYDNHGNSSGEADAHVFTDRYTNEGEPSDVKFGNGADTAKHVGLVMTTALDAISSAFNDIGKFLNPEKVNLEIDGIKGAANGIGAVAKKIGDISGYAEKAFKVADITQTFLNRPHMTDREYQTNLFGDIAEFTWGLFTDIAKKSILSFTTAMSVISFGASFAVGLAVDYALNKFNDHLSNIQFFQKFFNDRYEAKHSETPDGFSPDEDFESLSEELARGIEQGIERTEVMSKDGQGVPKSLTLYSDDLLSAEGGEVAIPDGVENIHIVGGGIDEITDTEKGTQIRFLTSDGPKEVTLRNIASKDVRVFDTFDEYADFADENATPRDSWENWVRSESLPVHYEASEGDDLLIGSDGADTIVVRGGNDEIYGADGGDSFVIDGSATTETDSFRIVDLNFEEGDQVTLQAFGDEIVVNSRDNLQAFVDAGYASLTEWDDESGDLDVTFTGLTADLPGLEVGDTDKPAEPIIGGKGNDALSGTQDDDLIIAGAGHDFVRGDVGNDVIRGGSGNDRLIGGAGSDILYGGTGSDKLNGGAGDDILRGGKGGDLLNGGTGNDTLHGGSGRDRLKGGAENDVIRGGSGSDQLYGGTGNDVLHGGSGGDYLNGGSGNDVIRGGNGRDRLAGGAGDDILHGGGGKDTFIFRGATGQDTIQDFNLDADLIKLSAPGLTFKDIAIHEDTGGTIISGFGDEDSRIFLSGVSGIQEDHFTF